MKVVVKVVVNEVFGFEFDVFLFVISVVECCVDWYVVFCILFNYCVNVG